MTAHPIVATQEDARTLAGIIRDAGGAALGETGAQAYHGSQGVVVQLVTAISAGSTATVKADIMELVAGVWQKTGSRIDVRSATGLAVSTTGRRIARQIGRNGWCVVET